MKILVAITTGRKSFKKTVQLLNDNFKRHDHFNNHQIDLMVNYDPTFLRLKDGDFALNEMMLSFNKIKYLGPKDIGKYIILLNDIVKSKKTMEILINEKGYGNKKNLLLIEAMVSNYDFILFWDDDEYPFACKRKKGGFRLVENDVLGPHINAIKEGGDISFGCFSGHVSPIPNNINKKLKKRDLLLLGKALEIGSDVINNKSFLNPEKSFEILNNLPKKSFIIQSKDGYKEISGGNLSINTSTITKGRLPPFYVPAGSRGDDTILSVRINDLKVVKVPSITFHDCFLQYVDFVKNDCLKENPINEEEIYLRFYYSIKGWLAYAPLFMKIINKRDYQKLKTKKLELISKIELSLDKQTSLEDIPFSMHKVLLESFNRIEIQQKEVKLVDKAWKNICEKLK